MNRTMFCVAAVAATVAGSLSTTLHAAEPLDVVPADALGLVVVDSLNSLDTKVGNAGESLKLPVPGLLSGLKVVPGLADCLDKDSPMVVALLEGAKQKPNLALVGYVPVTDFKAFSEVFDGEEEDGFVRLKVFGKTVLAAQKGGVAVLVENNDEAVLQRALASAGGIAKGLGDDLDWLRDRDVALVVTEAGISTLSAKVVEGLEAIQKIVHTQPENDAGAEQMLGIYKQLFAHADDEVEWVGIGLDIRDSGDLELRVRKRFRPEGQVAKCLALPEPEEHPLAALPEEPFVLAGAMQFNPAMGELMLEYSLEMMEAAPKLYGIDEADAGRLLESGRPMMTQMDSVAMLLAVGQPGDSVYSRMAGVMKTEDSEKYMAAYRDYIDRFGAMMRSGKGVFAMPMETKPIEVEGCKGFEVSMEFPERMFGPAPRNNEMLEKMIGPEGKLRVLIVAANESTVAIGYTNENLLRRILATLKGSDSLAKNSSIQQVDSRLDKANFGRGYLSPAGLIEFARQMGTWTTPAGAPQVNLPAFPETPPVAWSASAKGMSADLQLVIPGEVLKAGVAYSVDVRQSIPAGTQ